MAGGADSVIPAPLDAGASALIQAAPVYGTIIVGLAFFIVWQQWVILQSKAAHMADLKTYLTAVLEMKELITALVPVRRAR